MSKKRQHNNRLSRAAWKRYIRVFPKGLLRNIVMRRHNRFTF